MYDHNKELAGPVISVFAIRSAEFQVSPIITSIDIIEMIILSQSLSLLLNINVFSLHVS